MPSYRDKLDDLFIEKLGYEFTGESLAIPDIEGNENLVEISKDYSGNGIDVILVVCKDRILEFQKKLVGNQKKYFPNSHFLFISNNGKVFDLYNISTSKKLKPITYNEIDKNTSLFQEKIELFNIEEAEDSVDLRIKIEKAFETNDRVTKKFFDKFKSIHKKLQKAITGIQSKEDIEWYASVLMNRIMFIYFLQKHYVIQNDTNFLITKFDEVKLRNDDYYKDFLLPLFFYGFAKRENNPFKQEFIKKYGDIKYLNGGLFYPHHIEKKYYKEISGFDPRGEKFINTLISVDAGILNEILTFLNGYSWYLDHRPMKEDTDINPDVLGYIFEKYINQKELGAYYTKEDITEYITKNTIIPFILNKLRNNGFDAPDPSEFITNNNLGDSQNNKLLDFIEESSDFKLLKFLQKDILCELSVLDPAVGSGAFLFAALNILLPVYRKTIFKLKSFRRKKNDEWLNEYLDKLSKHSEEYYITKQIILNNLYGVDIVEEATEICKLRLFLQLASHLPDIKEIEPLPDIDFNIYAGNSLVGGLSWEDLQNNYTMDIFTSANRDKIKENIEQLTELKQEYKIVNEQIAELAALKEEYKRVQQEEQNEEKLKHLKNQIEFLEHELNNQIDVGISNPFHWFIEFDSILKKGGFDIVIGNPPYVEYSKVKKEYQIKGYNTEKCGNLYANFIERAEKPINKVNGYFGMIVPVASICTDGYSTLQDLLKLVYSKLHISSYNDRPGKLFDGLEHIRLSIILAGKGQTEKEFYTTKYNRWYSVNRDKLFSSLQYSCISNLNGSISFPKLGNVIAKDIYNKINSQSSLSNQINKGASKIYYTRKLSGFVQILSFVPEILDNEGVQRPPSELKEILFKNDINRDVYLAVFNSSLFYWYLTVNSDCRNLNKREIFSFPFNIDKAKKDIIDKLASLSNILMNDIEQKSERKLMRFKNIGTLTVQCTYPKYSKLIIDEIDKILAIHYNFSSEELDYILNYDLEFRTGNNDSENVEDEE